MDTEIVKCWFDGGCTVNPGGQATYGAIVRTQNGKTLLSESGHVGEGPRMSNNVAEYQGIIAVMKFLIANGFKRGIIYGDSELVVKQLNGKQRARKGLYLDHYKHALRLRRELPLVEIRWIPRNQNTEADYLARKSVRKISAGEKRNRELMQLIKAQRADERDTKRRLW